MKYENDIQITDYNNFVNSCVEFSLKNFILTFLCKNIKDKEVLMSRILDDKNLEMDIIGSELLDEYRKYLNFNDMEYLLKPWIFIEKKKKYISSFRLRKIVTEAGLTVYNRIMCQLVDDGVFKLCWHPKKKNFMYIKT